MIQTAQEKLAKAIDALAEKITVIADKITSQINSDDALKYTQAAQNVANTICSIGSIK